MSFAKRSCWAAIDGPPYRFEDPRRDDERLDRWSRPMCVGRWRHSMKPRTSTCTAARIIDNGNLCPQGMNSNVVFAVLLSVFLVMGALPVDCAKPFEDHPAQVSSVGETVTTGWLASASGFSYEFINAMLALSNGSTLVAGSFYQDIIFNGDIIGFSSNDSSFGEDLYMAWIDPNGEWNHSMSTSSGGNDRITSLAQLSDGTIVVAGVFCDMKLGDVCNMTLGELAPLQKADPQDDNAVFVAAMHPDGTWLWAHAYSHPYRLGIMDFIVDENDGLHLGLLHSGHFEVDNLSSPGVEGVNTLAVIGMDRDGNHEFLHSVMASDSLEIEGVLCADVDGRAAIAITFYGNLSLGDFIVENQGDSNVLVAHYSSTGWEWATAGGGVGEVNVAACAAHPEGGVNIVGDYRDEASFGTHDLPTAVWVDFYEATISSTGAWTGASGFGGTGADHAVDLYITPQGTSLITGKITGSLTLGAFVLEDLDSNNDGNHHDIFLAQRSSAGAWDWAISGGGPGNDVPLALLNGVNGSPTVAFTSNADGVFGAHSFDQRYQYDVGVWMYETDIDSDGVLDGTDNCPQLANPEQSNHDNDAFGDDCDDDDDGDGIDDLSDDCPLGEANWASNSLSDHDSDGCRDLNEDLDDDEDGVFDTNDLCPYGPVGWVSTVENDMEGDGCSDQDNDGDGWVDQADNCPFAANPTQADLDNDGIGDACDEDKDGDGVPAPTDQCPHDVNPWISFSWNDYDGDGCLDETMDEDDDNDGVEDSRDRCLLGASNWAENASELDHDDDGCADATEDDDDDDDGVSDALDRCPRGLIGVAGIGQDNDGDGCIDAVEDDDDDGDGVLDPLDACPNSNLADQISSNGCSQYQLDDDNDGVSNANDYCQNSPVDAIVDERGCTAQVQTEPTSSDSSGIGLAGYVFLMALAVAGFAFYTSAKRPGPPLPPMASVTSVVPTTPEREAKPAEEE